MNYYRYVCLDWLISGFSEERKDFYCRMYAKQNRIRIRKQYDYERIRTGITELQ